MLSPCLVALWVTQVPEGLRQPYILPTPSLNEDLRPQALTCRLAMITMQLIIFQLCKADSAVHTLP